MLFVFLAQTGKRQARRMAGWLEWAGEKRVWLDAVSNDQWPVGSLDDVRALADTDLSEYLRKRMKREEGDSSSDPVISVIEIEKGSFSKTRFHIFA